MERRWGDKNEIDVLSIDFISLSRLYLPISFFHCRLREHSMAHCESSPVNGTLGVSKCLSGG